MKSKDLGGNNLCTTKQSISTWVLTSTKNNTAVIMDCFNEKLGEIFFQNKPSEFGKLITKSKKYCTDGKGIVFALENSYGYGRALAVWLIE